MEIFAFIYATSLVFLSVILVATPFLICFWNDKKPLVPFRVALYVFGVLVLALLPYMKLSPSNLMNFPELAFTVAGIIGASIAILFSFSAFTLQSMSNFFSISSSLLANENKENIIFWALAILSITSCSIPYLMPENHAPAVLLIILWSAFCLIYELYVELRKRITLEDALKRIKKTAIKEMENKNISARAPFPIKNKFSQNEPGDRFNPGIKHITHLYEIGLKLLAKGEVKGCNLALEYIHDLYLVHLELEDGHFIVGYKDIGGDIGNMALTSQTMSHLESMGDHFIQEKRKDNVYFLLSVYENIIRRAMRIKYANDAQQKNNPELMHPLLTPVLIKYRHLTDAMFATDPTNWSIGAAHRIYALSSKILRETTDFDVFFHISHETHEIIGDAASKGLPVESLIVLTATCFDQINIILDNPKISPKPPELMSAFWGNLFDAQEKSILSLSKSGEGAGVIVLDRIFSAFFSRQKESAMRILSQKNKNEEAEGDFIDVFENWVRFIFNFSKRHGLNTPARLCIINSVNHNIEIIYMIKHSSIKHVSIDEVYKKNIDVLSFFFQSTEKHEISWKDFNFILTFLRAEIGLNLKHRIFDVEHLRNQYINLVDSYLNHTPDDCVKILEHMDGLYLLFEQHQEAAAKEKIRLKISAIKKEHLSGK